ncbi:MAG: hypothetical protein OXH99_07765, partial [Bryobacterales bacterium]|nr:hypothetical protein [Bryobacterales bacterium]
APLARRRRRAAAPGEAPVSRPAKALLAASAACFLLGWAALAAAWGNPGSDPLTALASAFGWPWLLASLQGAAVWARRRQRSADPFEHFLAVYAAGTAAAALACGLAIAAFGWEFPLLRQIPCGPFDPFCEALVAMAVAALAASATLGFAFPALLPPAAAALSARLLRGRHPSTARLAAGIAASTLGWLAAAFAGLALAHA